MSILFMQNKFLCDGIHTQKQSVVHLQDLYYHGFPFFLYFYHLIRYFNRQVIGHPVLSLGIIFSLVELLVSFMTSGFSFGYHTTHILVFKAFHWLTRLRCSGNKNVFPSTIPFFFFVIKCTQQSTFLLFLLLLVASIIYYFQAIQLLRVRNRYISFLVYR